MMCHNTNLERLQTLSLQYQYYLSSQDQHPVHMVHRPVLLRPSHKEHRPVPVLRMNPLTTMTSTEKENVAQQYRVLGVMTQEGQCNDASRVILFRDYGKQRTTGSLQLDYYTVCAAIIVLR